MLIECWISESTRVKAHARARAPALRPPYTHTGTHRHSFACARTRARAHTHTHTHTYTQICYATRTLPVSLNLGSTNESITRRLRMVMTYLTSYNVCVSVRMTQ